MSVSDHNTRVSDILNLPRNEQSERYAIRLEMKQIEADVAIRAR